jgi:hypothetical protein
MQRKSLVSLLGLIVAMLATHTATVFGGELKPYKGWILFAPETGPDGASYSVRHDNIGGIGLRRAVTVGEPVFEFGPGTVTMITQEEGVITYPNGDQIWDEATIVMVFDYSFFLLGGRVDASIVGGTGRFDGAYGWAWIDVTFDPPLDLENTEPFRMPVQGVISTVGSLKRK